MNDRRWTLDDAYGRRWRLWMATRSEAPGMPAEQARSAIRSLVWSALRAGPGRHDRAATTLYAVHDALTGGSLARTDRSPADLGATRRISEQVGDLLEQAASSGRLRIERAPLLHAMLVLETAPEVVAPPPSLAAPQERKVSDWVAIVVQDEDGEPLANVRCLITPPKRPPLEATTDTEGRVLLRGIEIGSCTVELLDADAREWAAQ